jgi:hypothetical protein
LVSFGGSTGVCKVNANSGSNVDYSAPVQVSQAFGVGFASQRISVTSVAPPANVAISGGIYTPTATSSSLLPVQISISPSLASVCYYIAPNVHFIGARTCVINFDQFGSTSFNAAPQVQMVVTVGKGTPVITFSSNPPAIATVDNGATP